MPLEVWWFWEACVGKLKSECAAATRDDTSSGSPTTRKLRKGESNWKLWPATIYEIISNFASNPKLLPPEAQRELATSKLILFTNEIHVAVLTGVTGKSQKRQDFLIMGKDRNCFLGLVVYPTIVSANCNEELTVLTQAYQPPSVIPEKTPIVTAIALPANLAEWAWLTKCQSPPESSDTETDVFWIKHINCDQPQMTCYWCIITR